MIQPAQQNVSSATHPILPVAQTPQAATRRNTDSATVFDDLYNRYLPFRLYADYMLGQSPAALAKQYGVAEYWVVERIEALRLCLGKQVRINLLSLS